MELENDQIIKPSEVEISLNEPLQHHLSISLSGSEGVSTNNDQNTAGIDMQHPYTTDSHSKHEHTPNPLPTSASTSTVTSDLPSTAHDSTTTPYSSAPTTPSEASTPTTPHLPTPDFNQNEVDRIIFLQSLIRRFQARNKFIKAKAAIVKIQSVVRSWRAARFTKLHIREHIFRTKAAFEIIRVERSYVSDLHVLIQEFCGPIRHHDGMLTEEDYSILFSNIEDILPLHTKLLNDMDARVNTWNYSQTISDVFSPAMINSFQELYEVYINNYERSFELLRNLRVQRPEFNSFLKNTECTQKCRGLDLTSFLVLPVQRFPRYIVLLKELQRHTAPQHPERKFIQLGLEALHSLTLYLNEAKRKQVNRDMVKKISHIVAGISKDLVTVDCQYLMEGVLKRVKGKLFKEKRPIYAFLFKDMMICAEQISEKNKPMSLANYRFSFLERISFDNVHAIRKSSISDGFHIELQQPKKDYLFCAGTEEKRNVWVKALLENMNDQAKKTVTTLNL